MAPIYIQSSENQNMLDIDSLAVDPSAAEEGVWASFMGAKFKIARHNSDRANQMRAKLTLARWDDITRGDEAAETLAAEIGARVLAESVLLDWKDVTQGGEPVTYTADVGFDYLNNPRFRDLAQFVENFSLNRGNYREKAEEEAAESVKDSAAS